MSPICALGYLGITAPDVEAWKGFASDVLGLQALTFDPAAGHLALRMDERPWRIRVDRGEGGLAFTGWEVPDQGALDEVADRLRVAGVPVESDTQLALERGVAGLLLCHDPAHNRLEIFFGAATAADDFVSPRAVDFVTGQLGLGHIVLSRSEIDDLTHFYRDVLGFRMSDTMSIGSISLVFMHVNARHHSLALAAIPGDTGGISHIMIEVADLDAVGSALDLAQAAGARVTRTLGRHINDHMVSFYVQTPSGFDVEYGWSGRTIDDKSWTVSAYNSPSLWGHRPVAQSRG